MKLLWSNLSLGGLYTDANADANNDNDANNDTNDNDNDTRRTEHDCIGSLPNEPKIKSATASSDCTLSKFQGRSYQIAIIS